MSKQILALILVFTSSTSFADVNLEDPSMARPERGGTQAAGPEEFQASQGTVAAEPFEAKCNCLKVTTTPSNLTKDEMAEIRIGTDGNNEPTQGSEEGG